LSYTRGPAGVRSRAHELGSQVARDDSRSMADRSLTVTVGWERLAGPLVGEGRPLPHGRGAVLDLRPNHPEVLVPDSTVPFVSIRSPHVHGFPSLGGTRRFRPGLRLRTVPTGPKPGSHPFHAHWDRHGWSRIRTCEGIATRFTVWPLWPLGYPPIVPRLPARLFQPTPRTSVGFRPRAGVGGSGRSSLLPPAKLAVRLELTTLGLQNRSSAG
jgi:hypothetical protein